MTTNSAADRTPHQHVGPMGSVTCYAEHSESPHDLIPREPTQADEARIALEAAEFALNLTVSAESDDRSWYDEACDALETVRFFLARLDGEQT